MAILFHLLLDFIYMKNWTQFMANGYPSHFLIGALIGGLVFHWVYKKSSGHLKSWIIALALVSAIGLVKELIDPYFYRQRDKFDLVTTILGGIIGAGIVVLFKKKKNNIMITQRPRPVDKEIEKMTKEKYKG